MQPYLHLGVGLSGSLLFLGDIIAQLACIAGSVLPDTASYFKIPYDLSKKQKPFSQMGEKYLKYNEAFHSFTIWSVIFFVTWVYHCYYFPLWFGCFVHLSLDVISHRDNKHPGPGMLYPLNVRLNGLYDYHPKEGPLWWSPWQVVISGFMILNWIVFV